MWLYFIWNCLLVCFNRHLDLNLTGRYHPVHGSQNDSATRTNFYRDCLGLWLLLLKMQCSRNGRTDHISVSCLRMQWEVWHLTKCKFLILGEALAQVNSILHLFSKSISTVKMKLLKKKCQSLSSSSKPLSAGYLRPEWEKSLKGHLIEYIDINHSLFYFLVYWIVV